MGTLGFNRETFRRYTAEDDVFLKQNYQTKGNFELGRILKRTAKSISKRMIILGLKRTDADLRFLAKTNRGRFKKGRKSEKEIPNGYLRLNFDDRINRNFYDIKIDKKFVRFSRYLYENYHNVKLKASDIIFHLDGDGMNVLKENLVMLTRSELLIRNNMTDEAFVKRIFRITDPVLIEKFITELPKLIELKRKLLTVKK